MLYVLSVSLATTANLFFRCATPLVLTNNTRTITSLNSQQSVFVPLTSSSLLEISNGQTQSYSHFEFISFFAQFDLFTLVIYFFFIVNPSLPITNYLVIVRFVIIF